MTRARKSAWNARFDRRNACPTTEGQPPAPSFKKNGLNPRPESAHQINDQANQQEQAKSAAADNRAAKIKAAAAEQEHEKEDD